MAVAAFVDCPPLVAVLSFFICLGYLSLNEVARELEHPFGLGANHLPVVSYQEAFNSKVSRLLDLSAPELGYRPPPGWSAPLSCAASTYSSTATDGGGAGAAAHGAQQRAQHGAQLGYAAAAGGYQDEEPTAWAPVAESGGGGGGGGWTQMFTAPVAAATSSHLATAVV